MGLAEHSTIDLISIDAAQSTVVLSLLEERPWGDHGELLPDLQSKLSCYLGYALDGDMLHDYPQVEGLKICFRLHYQYPPTQRELDFIDIVKRRYLEPEGIAWTQGPLGPATS